MVAGEQENHIGLVEAERFGFASVLVDVEVVDFDGAVGIGLGGETVFLEEAAEFGVGRVGVEGDDDADGTREIFKVGECLGREGETAVVGEIFAPFGVVAREVIEAAEEREHEEGLKHEVERAEPADSAETLERGRHRLRRGSVSLRR